MDFLSTHSLSTAVDFLVRIVEASGSLVIFLGAVYALIGFVRVLPRNDPSSFISVRLGLGRFLALGLEFQLASDILRTAISPSFEEIGKLAAVAAIRTVLNYFLAREVADEQNLIDSERSLIGDQESVK